MMPSRRLISGLLLCLSLALPASAQEAINLSPDALQQLTDQRAAEPGPGRTEGHELRETGNGRAEGISYHNGGTYLGSYRRSTSPVTGRLTHWVFDNGVFTRPNGDRYVGRFLFFHAVYNEQEKAGSTLPNDGTYIMVGRFIPKSGTGKDGIYYNNFMTGLPMRWIEADETFLAEIENSNRQQVAYLKDEIRREQAEADSGLSFGQVLALGLGAAALGAADIPSADALQIGSAFATDVLSGGETNALNQMIVNQQSASAAAAGANASGLGLGAAGMETPAADPATATYKNDQVTVSCPSGVSSTIPLSYKTEACRSAMISFAKVYACNMIDDFSAASASCQSACGDPQCRE